MTDRLTEIKARRKDMPLGGGMSGKVVVPLADVDYLIGRIADLEAAAKGAVGWLESPGQPQLGRNLIAHNLRAALEALDD